MELSAKIQRRLGPDACLDIEFALSGPECLAVFGPSGAGKSALLRCLAGLERPDQGRVSFNGQVWFDSEAGVFHKPQQRRIGFLFQEGALFPHLTVLENFRYGATPAIEPDLRLLGLLGLEGKGKRYPAELSAGERQRAALARALAVRPRLLLLDEPFSALDQPLRARLCTELKRILGELELPAILVTHDRAEALALADYLVLLDRGGVRQTGPTAEVFAHPRDVAVAQAVGCDTVVRAEKLGNAVVYGGNFACVRGEDVRVERVGPGREGSARERPGSLSGAGLADFEGPITWILREGPTARVCIDAGFPLVAILGKREFEELALHEGARVSAQIRADAIHWVAG